MATTDDYGQGVTVASLTDAPDAEALAKNVANGIVSRSVMRFASAAARTAALTGVSAPVEGMLSTLDDTDLLYRYNGSAWRLVAPFSQSGQETISFSNLALYTTTVTFPIVFASTPRVFTNINSQSGSTARWGSRAYGITTSGFTLFVYAGGDGSINSTWSGVPVQWNAVAP